jgi:hypothetical protein
MQAIFEKQKQQPFTKINMALKQIHPQIQIKKKSKNIKIQ